MRVIERMIPVGARLVLHGPVIPHDRQLWSYTPPRSTERLLIADLPSTQPDGGLQTNRRAGLVITIIGGVLLLAVVVALIIF